MATESVRVNQTPADLLAEKIHHQGPTHVFRLLQIKLARKLFEMREGELRKQCEEEAAAILNQAIGEV